MNFFEFGPRQDFSGYWPIQLLGEVSDLRIPLDSRKKERVISEHLGDPPAKARKHGNFHKSAYSFFIRSDALELVHQAARGNLLTSPTTIIGRESEDVYQIWVTNFVDCLDLTKTLASPPLRQNPGKIGVIRRPVFDEMRWDGSDLFCVPQDPSYCFFCSEDFVQKWKASKFKGAKFSRFLMDANSVIC